MNPGFLSGLFLFATTLFSLIGVRLVLQTQFAPIVFRIDYESEYVAVYRYIDF